MSDGLAVTVHDPEGDETVLVPAGDYLITCIAPCYVSHVQAYANGTHVITIKGRGGEWKHRGGDWRRVEVPSPPLDDPDGGRRAD